MKLFEKNDNTHAGTTIAAKIGGTKVQEVKAAVKKMNGGNRNGK